MWWANFVVFADKGPLPDNVIILSLPARHLQYEKQRARPFASYGGFLLLTQAMIDRKSSINVY
jgi:hypothetical protein